MEIRNLTEDEQKVINHLADAWNAFLELPIEHNDDINEFRYGIHTLQRHVMCRPIRETMK